MSEIKNKIDKAHSFWKVCSNIGYFVFPSSWIISSLISLPKYGHLSIWIGILVGLGFVGLWLIVYEFAFRRLINLYKEPKRSIHDYIKERREYENIKNTNQQIDDPTRQMR